MLIKKETRQLPVMAVDVGKRRYPPSETRVKKLAAAMLADGVQLEPIVVRRVTRDTFKIVCGAARLLAARRLNWPTVNAQIVGGLPIDYDIAEVAENFDRGDLTRKQRSEIQRELKQLRKQRETEQLANVEPCKGGRGHKGGTREAARQMEIPESTARVRQQNKVRKNESSCAVSGDTPPEPEPETPPPAGAASSLGKPE